MNPVLLIALYKAGKLLWSAAQVALSQAGSARNPSPDQAAERAERPTAETGQRKKKKAATWEDLEEALHAIKPWHDGVMKDIVRHDTQKKWIRSSTVAGYLETRPTIKLNVKQLQDLLNRDDIKNKLGTNYNSARANANLWAADLAGRIANRNDRFLKEELAAQQQLFDTVESRPLTEEQRRAAVCFDDRILVVAAAGSGKTSTMVAKAAYAVSRKLVAAENVVLLAFNNAAAKELEERVQRAFKALGLVGNVKTSTFHKLGSDVIAAATGRKMRAAPWIESLSDSNRKLLEIVDELKDADLTFRAQWDLFRIVFSRDLPGFGRQSDHEDWDKETKKTGFRTLRGELVKSLEERALADWCFYNGVRYLYEQPYKVDTATSRHSQYRPDFYYPDIDLYHEHFALNAKGEAPPEFDGYMESVEWRREVHKKNKTAFIETTSAQIYDGTAFDVLEKALVSRGVKLDPNPDRPVQGRKVSDSADMAGLFRTFICHAKSNDLSIDDLRERLKQSSSDTFGLRHRMFLNMYESIRAGWDAALKQADAIDFEDMLHMAAEHAEGGRWASPYDLLMVDEFQDTSWSRARLLLAMAKKPGSVLFAVGDDWQSINRFAGADLSVMTGFEKWCGAAQTLRLEETFRCPQELCDLSSGFIVKNPKQIKKTVRSNVPSRDQVLKLFRVKDVREIRAAVENALHGAARHARESGRTGVRSVKILGRYNSDEQFVPTDWRDKHGDVLDVVFSTVHSAKGLEADVVIVPNCIKRGFPSSKEDDPILLLAMPAADMYPHSEERRLFYVALTRARESVVLITVEGRESPFVLELAQNRKLKFVDISGEPFEAIVCSVCNNGVMVERMGKYGPFLSCTNFPACKHKQNISPRALPHANDGRESNEPTRRHFVGRSAPKKAGVSWSKAEEAELSKAHSAGMSIEQLAELHQRTPGAIRSRLEKMGLAPPGYGSSQRG